MKPFPQSVADVLGLRSDDCLSSDELDSMLLLLREVQTNSRKWQRTIAIQCESYSIDDIIVAMKNIGLSQSAKVTIIWPQSKFGLRSLFGEVVFRFEEMWFPSSTDIAMILHHLNTIVLLDHEEMLSVWTRSEANGVVT